MKLPESIDTPDRRTLRQFVLGWLIFFLGAGAVQAGVHHRAAPALWLGFASLIGPALSWLSPALFARLFKGWMLLAFPFGWLGSQLILALMFFGVLTPVAVLFRLVRRDRLNRFNFRKTPSYWLAKKPPADVRSYFHPY